MRHPKIFLKLAQIERGVDETLSIVPNLELHRPPAPPDGVAIHTIQAVQFPDGVSLQIRVNSLAPAFDLPNQKSFPDNLLRLLGLEDAGRDLGLEMLWYYFPSDPLDETRQNQGGILSWFLEVDVHEVHCPWPNPGKDRDLGKVRCTLDRYAVPRLILPMKNVADYRDDCVALVALFASKAKCLAPQDDEFPKFFRRYCNKLFVKTRQRSLLSEAEWFSAVDRVFRRLFGAEKGAGFTMPLHAGTFGACISRAVRGAVAEEKKQRCRTGLTQEVSDAGLPRRPDRRFVDVSDFPATIDEAANRLRVSSMTVRRDMKALKKSKWNPDVWEQIATARNAKNGWRKVQDQLQNGDRSKTAARRCALRWKKRGMSLDEALQRSKPEVVSRDLCAACGEACAARLVYEGRFFCSECFAEKTGQTA
jgi:hypothetical protein